MTDELAQARMLEQEGRLEQALRVCLGFIEKSPRHVEARSLAVALALRLDQFVEWSHQLLALADLHQEESRPEEALTALEQFLRFPMEGRSLGERNLHILLKRQVYFQKGVIHRDCQRMQAAERSFRKSLTLAPDRWQTYLELGRTLMSVARYQEAAQVLLDGRQLSPVESGPVHEALGDAYYQLGRDARVCYEEAITHYKSQGLRDDVLRVSERLLELFGDEYLEDILTKRP